MGSQEQNGLLSSLEGYFERERDREWIYMERPPRIHIHRSDIFRTINMLAKQS